MLCGRLEPTIKESIYFKYIYFLPFFEYQSKFKFKFKKSLLMYKYFHFKNDTYIKKISQFLAWNTSYSELIPIFSMISIHSIPKYMTHIHKYKKYKRHISTWK